MYINEIRGGIHSFSFNWSNNSCIAVVDLNTRFFPLLLAESKSTPISKMKCSMKLNNRSKFGSHRILKILWRMKNNSKASPMVESNGTCNRIEYIKL